MAVLDISRLTKFELRPMHSMRSTSSTDHRFSSLLFVRASKPGRHGEDDMRHFSERLWARLGLSSVLLSGALSAAEPVPPEASDGSTPSAAPNMPAAAVAPSALAPNAAAAALAPNAPAAAASEAVSPSPTAQHAAAVLKKLGKQEQHDRIIASSLSVVLGSAAIATGLFVDRQYDQSYGEVLWITGLLGVGGGLLGLVTRGPMQRFAEEWHSDPSPALQSAWHIKAEQGRSSRKVLGVINLVIGGAGIASGALLLAGAGDLNRSDQANLATLAFLGGGLFASAGIAGLTLESGFERGYGLAYPAAASALSPLHIGFAPARGGGSLRLTRAF